MSRRLERMMQRSRLVPTKGAHRIRTDWFRTFSWKERFQILFGYNLIVMVGISTQHSPGKHQPWIIGRVTQLTQPDQVMQSEIEQQLADNPNLPHTGEV